MVYCGEKGEGVRDLTMAKGPEIPQLQRLHNWANQRPLLCMKIPDDSNTTTTTAVSSSSNNNDEGIQAVREETILDLKKAADRMKDELLSKRVSNDEKEERGDDEQEEEEEYPAAAPGEEQEVRPWNLRTRRNSDAGKGLRIEERKDGNNYNSKRPRFFVTLSKEEIRADFIKFVRHPPPRRPEKRQRMVQRRLDLLFPGLWLTEATANWYKMPELGDKGKRLYCRLAVLMTLLS